MENKNIEILSNGTHIDWVFLDDIFTVQFIYCPKGFKVISNKLEGHLTKKIGKLNSFNRLKSLESWRDKKYNLVDKFKEVLIKKGWDFDKYPNPDANLIVNIKNFEKANKNK